MDDDVGCPYVFRQHGKVEHVTFNRHYVRMFSARAVGIWHVLKGAIKEDDLIVIAKPLGKGNSDEASAASNEHPLIRNQRAQLLSAANKVDGQRLRIERRVSQKPDVACNNTFRRAVEKCVASAMHAGLRQHGEAARDCESTAELLPSNTARRTTRRSPGCAN